MKKSSVFAEDSKKHLMGVEGCDLSGIDAAEHLEMGAATSARASHDVQDVVMVDVGHRDKHPTGEGPIISHDLKQGVAGVGTVDDANNWKPARAHGGDDVRGAVIVEVGAYDSDLTLESRERCDGG